MRHIPPFLTLVFSIFFIGILPAQESCTCSTTITQGEEEFKTCLGDDFLYQFYRAPKYPPAARKAGIQGTAIVGFSARHSDGCISDIEIIKDVKDQFGEALMTSLSELSSVTLHCSGEEGECLRFEMPVKFSL